MLKRALSANSAAGRSTRDLLDRMKAGNENGVREFIISRGDAEGAE